MHVELVDLFRCPYAHEDSPLVAASDRSESRTILDGTLGCPVCGAEYAIRGGVSHFTDLPASGAAAIPQAAAPHPDDDHVMRVAALLDATSASATVALVGGSVAMARAMQGIVPARCIVVNGTDEGRAADRALPDDAPLSVIRAARALPMARGSLSGVLFVPGAALSVETLLPSLRPGGRLVAPISVAVPAGVRELARDASDWVAERAAADTSAVAPAALTQLRRRR